MSKGTGVSMEGETLKPRAPVASPRAGAGSLLRRSLLFVPGAEPRKLERADSTGADTLVFDLEDSVEAHAKERARALVAERVKTRTGDTEYVVRINGCETSHFERDVMDVVAAGARCLMLPKSCPATLARARLHLAHVEQRLGLENGCIRLLGLVETANGVVRLPRLLSEPARLDALWFGNADFSFDMGHADSDLGTGVVHHARCSLAITAAAAGVVAIDGVCLAIRDDDAFESEARNAQSLGYTGKLCLHPAQVAVANAMPGVSFSMTVVDIERGSTSLPGITTRASFPVKALGSKMKCRVIGPTVTVASFLSPNCPSCSR